MLGIVSKVSDNIGPLVGVGLGVVILITLWEALKIFEYIQIAGGLMGAFVVAMIAIQLHYAHSSALQNERARGEELGGECV